VRLGVGCVDHQYLGVLGLCGQFGHNRSKHAHPAPSLPTVIERLRPTIDGRCVLPHQHPSRCMKIVPLRTRLLSTRSVPRDFGKYGRSRSTCASDHQNKSLIIPPHFEGLNHVASRRSKRFMGPDSKDLTWLVALRRIGCSCDHGNMRRNNCHGAKACHSWDCNQMVHLSGLCRHETEHTFEKSPPKLHRAALGLKFL